MVGLNGPRRVFGVSLGSKSNVLVSCKPCRFPKCCQSVAPESVTKGQLRVLVFPEWIFIFKRFASRPETFRIPPRFKRHCQVNTGRRQLTDGIPVSTPSLSTRDHQPCRLAVPSVHAELSRCRRSSRGAWRNRILRGHSILVPEVWTSLCSYFAATTRSTRRHLARGRSVHHHPRRTSLSLESGGLGRRRPGYFDHTPPRQESR